MTASWPINKSFPQAKRCCIIDATDLCAVMLSKICISRNRRFKFIHNPHRPTGSRPNYRPVPQKRDCQRGSWLESIKLACGRTALQIHWIHFGLSGWRFDSFSLTHSALNCLRSDLFGDLFLSESDCNIIREINNYNKVATQESGLIQSLNHEILIKNRYTVGIASVKSLKYFEGYSIFQAICCWCEIFANSINHHKCYFFLMI